MANSLELKGKRFGRLQVIHRVQVPGARNAMWKCFCDCGAFTVAAASNIGKTTFSCGCLWKETAAKTLKAGDYSRTHGMAGTPEYTAWSRMKLRCNDPKNPKYKDYGGRGIRVCARWLESFENFYSDMGDRPTKRHSLGRKNNNGNYEPKNCRWETPTQQVRNTRINRNLEIDGIKMCISAWCHLLGVRRARPYELAKTKSANCATVEDAVKRLYYERG